MRILIVATLVLLAACDTEFGFGLDFRHAPIVRTRLDLVTLTAVDGKEGFRIPYTYMNRSDRTIYVQLQCGLFVERKTADGWVLAFHVECLNGGTAAIVIPPGESFDSVHLVGAEFAVSGWEEGEHRLVFEKVSDKLVDPISVGPSLDAELRTSNTFLLRAN